MLFAAQLITAHYHHEMVELRQLRYFVAVAETLHFRRAAERLLITQPALSHQIASLEHQLGVRLLDRDRRHVELTPAGQVLLDAIRPALAQSAQALAAARWAGGITSHAIRLAYPIDAERVVRLLLDGLRERQPDIWVADYHLQTAHAAAALADGSIDAAFLPQPADGSLAWIPLRPGQLVVWLPAQHPLAAVRGPLELSHMADQPLLAPAPDVAPGYRAMLAWVCHLGGFRPDLVDLDPTARRTAGELARLVAAGRGLLLTASDPATPLPEIWVGRVALPATRGPGLGLAWRRRGSSAQVQALADLMADNQPFAPEPEPTRANVRRPARLP